MQKPTVDEILQQGIQGPKEIKPEERRKFLGTLRERILAVLKKSQVREKEIYPEVEQLMKKNPGVQLLLNGSLDYMDLSKYVKLAKKYKARHTIVTNKEYDTEIGLVLAMDHAIDQPEIYLEKKEQKIKRQEKTTIFSKLFRHKW